MVASTRAGSKRYLLKSQLEGAGLKRGKRARRSFPQQSFPLLSLPSEVRYYILRELLLLSEPIEFTAKSFGGGTVHQWREYFASLPPPRLWPQILYTCRQLYDEGSNILYANTIKCRIRRAEDLWGMMSHTWTPTTMILGPNWGSVVGRLPPSIRNKISRVHIEIRPHCSDSEEELRIIREHARVLVKGIRTKASNWTDISIELLHDAAPGSGTFYSLDDADNVLQPFSYVRDRSRVTIKGASEPFASRLVELMTSTKPCIELDFMFDAVETYVDEKINQIEDTDSNTDDEDTDEDTDDFNGWLAEELSSTLAQLKRARDENNVENFYKHRSLIMLLVALYEKGKHMEVFRHDPPGLEESAWLHAAQPLLETSYVKYATDSLDFLVGKSTIKPSL